MNRTTRVSRRHFCVAALACPLPWLLSACGQAVSPAATVPVSPTTSATGAPTVAPIGQSGVRGGSRPVVLAGAILVDGTGRPPVADAALVVADGRVAAAGPRSKVQVPQGAEVISLERCTILPGFTNAHVHEAYDAGHLEAWAQAGVTTVRDLSPQHYGRTRWQADYEFKDLTDKDPAKARIVGASPIMAPPGGYTGLLPVASPEDGRRQVNAILDLGADLIKIAFEDSLPPGQHPPLLGVAEARAIVEEAHRRGVRVSAHVTLAHHVERALAAGVDDLAHMVYDQLPDSLIAQAIGHDITWVPTLELWDGVGYGRAAIGNLARFVEAGGRVALGTDYAGYSIQFQLGMPAKEMALMALAGMSPMQTVVAATQNAARVSGLEGHNGTLQPGKTADILVVEGDPLSDLGCLTDVRLVMHRGQIIRSRGA